MFMLQNTIRQD